MMKLPDIEVVAAKVHQAWIGTQLAAGVTSRLAANGDEMMRPYEELSEVVKDIDRATVRAVYGAIMEANGA